MLTRISLTLAVALAVVGGCGSSARLPDSASQGPNPELPPPDKSLVPTVHVAEAKGWPAGEQPRAASGLRVTACMIAPATASAAPTSTSASARGNRQSRTMTCCDSRAS